MQIIKWDKIRQEIETSKDIQTLTTLKNKLRAYQILSEQSKQSLEVQAKIAIYKARADRKCGEWLQENVKLGNPKQLKGTNIVPLKEIGITKNESSRLQRIASIPEEKFESILEVAEAEHKKVTSNMLVSIEREVKRDEKINKQKEEIRRGVRNPDGLFDIIVVDPPWPYGTDYDPETRRIANPYPEMSIEEIVNLKIPAKNDCILWLWTTHKFIFDARNIVFSWGFDYKATLVWDKEKMGMGSWLRMQCEFCLLAIKGSPLWENKNMRDIVRAPRTEHSAKPKDFYDFINKNFEGRKLEYFSRIKRDGWECFGDEIDNGCMAESHSS